MTCEEFEAIGLDAERDASASASARAAAQEHLSACPRCAALENSWRAARLELRAFAEDTAAAQVPARVEMRLRQEFRTRYRTHKARRAAVVAAWALAAAAVFAGAVSWKNWRKGQQQDVSNHLRAPQSVASQPVNNGGAKTNEATAAQTTTTQKGSAAEPRAGETLLAENDAGEFTLLPGVLPAETDDAAILRVRMQRGALGALGLPVNEERAGEWIQVDLLVGDDGWPQAVRLPQ